MIDDGVSLGRVLTLGRQTTLLNSRDYRALMARVGVDSVPPMPTFADDVLLAMGGTEVVSMDFSAYEGATLLHDLNDPIGEELRESFDLVFEGGTLEHVFEFPVAIASCMRLLRQGAVSSLSHPRTAGAGMASTSSPPSCSFAFSGRTTASRSSRCTSRSATAAATESPIPKRCVNASSCEAATRLSYSCTLGATR